MNPNCSKCGTHLSVPWSFCPHCGAEVKQEAHPSAHEHHPARGAFGGMSLGLIVAPILIIPGVLLCLLGWGIFFGVPMIVMGILAPLVGPVFGMGEHLGKCPTCGTRVIGLADGKSHGCPICNTAFDIEDTGAVKAH